MDDAIRSADETQMSAARDEVREMLGHMPHLDMGSNPSGVAGAFIAALEHQTRNDEVHDG